MAGFKTVSRSGKVIKDTRTSSSLSSGFNAQGQAVVQNAFGGWSPVVNGVVQMQSAEPPIVPASIYTSGGGGGSFSPSPSQQLIITSTPTNQAQVQQQLSKVSSNIQAQRDAIARKVKKAYKQFNLQVSKVSNLSSLSPSVRAQVINRAQGQAQNYYQRAMSSYYSNRRVPSLRTEDVSGEVLRSLPSFKGIRQKIDILSGGRLSAPQFDKIQGELNKKVESFNKKYQNKSLPPQEAVRVQKYANELERGQLLLDRARGRLETAPSIEAKAIKGKILKSAQFGIATATAGAIASIIEIPRSVVSLVKNPKLIKEIPRGIINTIKDAIIKDKDLIMINPTAGIARVATQIGIQYVSFKLTGGGLKSVKGKVGLKITGKLAKKVINKINPYFLIKAKKGIKIAFVGKQYPKGGKIITDIAFTSGRKAGIARGVSAIARKRSLTLILGKFGTKRFLRKLGTSKLKKLRYFLGAEKGLTKSGAFKSISQVRIPKVGTLNVIKQNIRGLKQIGIGRSFLIKGKRFLKSAKVLDKSDFISLSSVLTKGEWSKIVGRTITSKGNKASFIGLIKGASRNVGKINFNPTKSLQYSRALKKVASVISSALSQTPKKGLSESARLGATALVLRTAIQNVGSSPSISSLKQQIKIASKTISPTSFIGIPTKGIDLKYKTSLKTIQKQKDRTKSAISSLLGQSSQLMQRMEGASSSKSKFRFRTQLKETQIELQRQRQGLKQIQIQQQMRFTSPRIAPPFVMLKTTPVRSIPFSKFRKSQFRKLNKAIPTFNVYAKVGRKFIKINKGVLSRADALNKGTYAIDHTVARTFKIIPAGRRKTIYGVPNIEKDYYKRGGYKLREYRIKRGKKFGVLPKYIERRRFGIDTRGEKKGLSISRYIKGFGKGGRGYAVKRARRISSAQRKVMLKNLAKARRVLAKKR